MFGFEIDRTSVQSNALQLENQIRDAILRGELKAGDSLPPTRVVAKDLQIARNTVIQVYEQLIAEGYLIGKGGAGTYVAEIGKLPLQKLLPYHLKKEAPKKQDRIVFDAGSPDIGAFPRIAWAKLLKEACLEAEEDAFVYHYYSGYPKLKQALCDYVYRMKGIRCEEEQIIIVPGAAGGLELLAKIFERKKNRIAIEDPCIHFVKKIFSDHKYELCPIKVDRQGMDMESLYRLDAVNLIYVVPSHQYPLGGVFPAPRRISLLQYACEKNAYIIEDDYDSEFRYKGEALQALRNLNQECVIYIGSFSKIFSPALRMGYMILPAHLCEPAAYELQESNLWVNPIEQHAMAEFMNQKLMDRHIYKMRKLYEHKRLHLIHCLEEAFGDSISISGEYAGLHLLVSFGRELTETDYRNIDEQDVEVDYVEDYALVKGRYTNQIVLGYGGLSLAQITEGVQRLKKALG
jgi:GntR family transcriptional regulator/MocR family aminotransferase